MSKIRIIDLSNSTKDTLASDLERALSRELFEFSVNKVKAAIAEERKAFLKLMKSEDVDADCDTICLSKYHAEKLDKLHGSQIEKIGGFTIIRSSLIPQNHVIFMKYSTPLQYVK